MSNLLPQEEKKVLEKEYIVKLAILGNFLFSGTMLVVIVFMGIFVFLLKNEQKILQAHIDISNLSEEEKTYKEIVNTVNTKLKTLQTQIRFLTPLEAIQLILRNKNSGISVTSFDFSNALSGGSLQISGIAATREDLIAFLKNLENEEIIQTVDSPISNLSKSSDISFNAAITLTNNEEER